jgi:hypothetical protein
LDSELGDDDANNGGINDPWETLQKAADNVGAGEIVYVRARNTPYDPFTMKASGTATNNRIKFIGWNTSSTDLDAGQGVPYKFDDIQVGPPTVASL